MTHATEEGYTHRTFEAKDVRVVRGTFRHVSCKEGPLLGLHGVLGPHGKARGVCIGVVNGGAWHGPEWVTTFTSVEQLEKMGSRLEDHRG